jgi:hypothetical protein
MVLWRPRGQRLGKGIGQHPYVLVWQVGISLTSTGNLRTGGIPGRVPGAGQVVLGLHSESDQLLKVVKYWT